MCESLQIDQNHTVTANELIQTIESCQSGDMVLKIATSGSQSKAKIVLISRANIIAHCESFVQTIPIQENSVWLNCMPLNHIAGIMIVYRSWFFKASMILHDTFNEGKIWLELHQSRITHISLVPRMLLRLLDYQSSLANNHKKLPSTLKYVLVGGDSLSENLQQRAIDMGWPIYISYGMTEACSTIAVGRQSDKLELLQGIAAKVNSNGILQLKGKQIVGSSLSNKKLENKESNNKNLENKKFTDRWFTTSDLACLNKRNLSILGRNDHSIIRSGENILPETIEALLSSAPGINDIAITKYRDPDNIEERGDSIIALVRYKNALKKTTHNNEPKFKQWIQANIEIKYQPNLLIEVDNIPRTTLGKIKRQDLQPILFAHSSFKSLKY